MLGGCHPETGYDSQEWYVHIKHPNKLAKQNSMWNFTGK